MKKGKVRYQKKNIMGDYEDLIKATVNFIKNNQIDDFDSNSIEKIIELENKVNETLDGIVRIRFNNIKQDGDMEYFYWIL